MSGGVTEILCILAVISAGNMLSLLIACSSKIKAYVFLFVQWTILCPLDDSPVTLKLKGTMVFLSFFIYIVVKSNYLKVV